MRTVFEQRVLGPEYPAFERLKVITKTNPSQGRRKICLIRIQTKLSRFVNGLLSHDNFKGVKVRGCRSILTYNKWLNELSVLY